LRHRIELGVLAWIVYSKHRNALVCELSYHRHPRRVRPVPKSPCHPLVQPWKSRSRKIARRHLARSYRYTLPHAVPRPTTDPPSYTTPEVPPELVLGRHTSLLIGFLEHLLHAIPCDATAFVSFLVRAVVGDHSLACVIVILDEIGIVLPEFEQYLGNPGY
jgi:hypothetical protein